MLQHLFLNQKRLCRFKERWNNGAEALTELSARSHCDLEAESMRNLGDGGKTWIALTGEGLGKPHARHARSCGKLCHVARASSPSAASRR